MGFFNERSLFDRLIRLGRNLIWSTPKYQMLFRPTGVQLRLSTLEDRCLPSVTPQEFVSQVYIDLLHRAVDSSGLPYWSGLLGQESAAQVVLGIETSSTNEYQSDEVNQIYETLLNRGVDAGSLGYWVGVEDKSGYETTEADIAGSAEFFNDGGGTDAGFLSLLYRDLLHRNIDPSGAAGYGAELAGGTSRADVAYQILTSTEYRTDLVESYYTQFLHRDADPAGLSFWVGQLDSGASDQDVIAGILSSAEYSAQAPNAPTVTVPAASETVNTATFTIEGTAESGTLVQIFSNGNVVGSEQLTVGTTNYSITVPLTTSSVNNFDVTATNALGNQSAETAVPAITQSSETVTVTAPAEQRNHEGDTVDLSITATDSEGAALTYSATGLPAGLSIDSTTGVITGTITTGDTTDSPYSVTVTATDAVKATGSTTFTWLVDNSTNPTVTPPANQTNTEGDTVSGVKVTATEPNKNPLTYSATDLPAGLSINATTGVISGTVTAGDATGSPYTVTVSATDGLNTGSATFIWTINPVLVVTPPADQTNSEGDVVTDVAVAATDSKGSTITYSAQDLPAGLTIDSTTGVISGTIGDNDATDSPYTVTVSATDGTYNGSATFTWTVNTVVVVANPGDQTNDEGDVLSNTNGVTVTATDSKGGTLTYIASGLPAGLSINSTTGIISGTIGDSDATDSPYIVTVTASDGTYNGSATFTWLVNGGLAAPVVTAPATAVSTTASTYEIDGTAVSGSFVQVYSDGTVVGSEPLASGVTDFSISVSLTASSANNFDVTATNAFGNQSPDAVVPPITQSSAIVTVTTPAEQENYEGDTVNLQMTGTDTNSLPLTYSATGLPLGLTISATGLIAGSITMGDATSSPYTVIVTATDGPNSGTATFTWLVDNTTLPVVTPPDDQTNTEGQTVSGVTVTATAINNNPLTFSATNLPAGLSIDPTTGVISGTIAANTGSSNAYTVTVSATDGLNTGVATFTWTVNPVVDIASPGNQTNSEGATVSGVMVTASDANSTALTYIATGLPAGLSIDSSTGVISGKIDNSEATGSPYSVTVTATDGTYSSSTSFTWTVTSPVTFTTPANQSNVEGATIDLTVAASDANSLPLTYSATGLPSGLTIDASTGVISGKVAAGDTASSPYTVTVSATDGTYTGNSTTFTWTVSSPVAITTPANQTNYELTAVSLLTVVATDADSLPLTYTATGLPNGLSIDSSTGVIGGTLASGDASSSPYTVTVSVTDGTYTGSSTTFTWTVNPTVDVTPVAEQANHEGDTVSVQVTASDSTANSLTYSATGLPTGLSIDPTTGSISGIITSGASTDSPYTAIVTVTDSTTGQSGNTTITWLVYNPADPLLNPPATQLNINGDTVSGVTVTATGTGSDPITYSATNLPSGLAISSTTGVISGTIASTASDTSPYTVTVTATQDSNTSSATFTWVVTPSSSAALPYSLTSPEWVTLPSGVRYLDLKVGSGTAAAVGDSITVNYLGYLTDTDGTPFSGGEGNNFSSTLNTSSLIAGWVDGVPGMMPGGTRLLDIPASLAYGSAGSGSIPANAELVFEITLISAST